jgi:DNA excision repair protein ERCC-2
MAIKIEDKNITLSVRDIVGAGNQRQVLSSFPLPQRGMLGQQAQANVQQIKDHRRGLFHTEYFVSHTYPYQGYQFTVQGRIDSVYQFQNRMEIEEIKSVILTKKEFNGLHIEKHPEYINQALFYAYLLQDKLKSIEIGVYIILVNLIDNSKRSFSIPYNRKSVERLLLRRFDTILQNIGERERKITFRTEELKKIKFTLPEKRPQQQRMMEAVSDILGRKRHLLVSAPTGSGKTAAALFPALKFAYLRDKKVFFVTSKTTQQAIVEETARYLIDQGMKIKVLLLRASEKMCPNKIHFCHEAYCPFAENYRERLLESNLIAELLQNEILTPDLIYKESVKQTLCPFEVSLDLSFHADLIVGDYNYVFDPAVFLRRLFGAKDFSDWILIIDEAHNLYERGLEYLSPAIERKSTQNLIKWNRKKKNPIYKDLVTALREIDRLFADIYLEGELHYSDRQYYRIDLNTRAWEEVFSLYESAFLRYLIYNIKKNIVIIDDPLEEYYYQLRRFVKISQIQDPTFVPFANALDGGIVKIQCCDPSNYLGRRIDGFHSVIAMSATLDPIKFYEETLGFNKERTEKLLLDSPFPNNNRKIVIIPNISTRYKDRLKNYQKIAEIINRVSSKKAGNYLCFFPSFEFMQNVNLFLTKDHYGKLIQKPGMKEKEREEILTKLREENGSYLLLGAIGGAFSEGVDYLGRMAIGVIIISPALPKINFERELLRNYYENNKGAGFEYAYIYPGMNKVIQSAGRLIRSFTDKGILVLVGERFAEDKFSELFPEYWYRNKGDLVITEQYEEEIESFWSMIRKK